MHCYVDIIMELQVLLERVKVLLIRQLRIWKQVYISIVDIYVIQV
jgi:hypothetical protein